MIKMLSVVLLIIHFTSGCLWSQSEQVFADIGNLPLTSGDTLYSCRIGYRTFGQINEKEDNIIVYPTFFGGTTQHLASLIGKNKIVDSSNYYIIAIDALGNGISTSPSNYPMKSFPPISILDMVNSQYKLLTEKLGLKKVKCIVGGSMGGLQVFEWLKAYPDFMQRAIPYLGTPQPTSYDLLFFKGLSEILKSGIRNHYPVNDLHLIRDIYFSINANTPDFRNEKTPRKDFVSFFEGITGKPGNEVFTIENSIVQLDAIVKYNMPGDRTIEEVAKRTKAGVFVIVSATDHVVNPAPAIEFASALKCKLLILENNCGHGAISCEMARVSKEISCFLEE